MLASPNQTLNTSTDSALVTWNGTDTGYNQFYDFSDFVTSAHQQVGQNDYMLGYDTFGACIYNGVSKVRSLPNTRAPAPSATFQNGNMLYFMGNDFDAVTGKTFASLYVYGRFDEETDPGLFRLVRDNCGSNGSIVSIPWCVPVTNQFGGSSFAYKSRAKVYFSAFDGTNYFLMSQNIGTAKGTAPSTNASYYTQSHKWKSRKSITEVRVYVDDSYPGANATGNISLYKLSGNTIGNVAQLVYTINKNVDYAHDFGRATVQAGPVYEAQLRIFAPSDITGFVIRKVEVDVIDSPA